MAAVVACTFNALLRTAVRAVAHVPDAFDPFTWPPILVATCAGVAAGTVVFLVLRSFLGARTNVVFTWLGYGVLVLSLVTPVTLMWSHPPQYPGTSWLTVIALECMHVSTAVATIGFLTSANRSGPRP